MVDAAATIYKSLANKRYTLVLFGPNEVQLKCSSGAPLTGGKTHSKHRFLLDDAPYIPCGWTTTFFPLEDSLIPRYRSLSEHCTVVPRAPMYLALANFDQGTMHQGQIRLCFPFFWRLSCLLGGHLGTLFSRGWLLFGRFWPRRIRAQFKRRRLLSGRYCLTKWSVEDMSGPLHFGFNFCCGQLPSFLVLFFLVGTSSAFA